jgi:hypothetical protein
MPHLAKRYSYVEDTGALEAGRRISRGDHTWVNIEVIFRWNTVGRGISRLSRNSDLEIADSLRLAVVAQANRLAVSVLTGLNSVNVPVASATLTVIDQQRYTTIDFCALEALGVGRVVVNINFYLEYLGFCRHVAKGNKINLRNLDRALWQWSKEESLSNHVGTL